MTTLAAAPPRKARAAVAALFLTNGAVFFAIVPRFPQIKADLDVSNVVFGTALAAMPAGALIAGLLAGAAIRWLGSAKVAAFGMVLFTAATLVIPFAPHWLVFAGAMFLLGALDSIVDVAQNAHGLRVQRLYGRSILNSLHGLWSIGAVLGGLLGSAAAGLKLPLGVHLAISAVLFSTVALIAYRFTLPGAEHAERSEPPTGRPVPKRFTGTAVRMLAVLGVLAAAGALVEDAGSSWGALFFTEDLRTGAATAGLAVVALQTAMTVGRLLGDRVVDRFGQRAVVRAGGFVTAVGMGLALAFPSVPSALAGFALAGLGGATLVPAAMHAADELPGLSPGTGLTIVSWLLRGGFLISPPLVGYVADLWSLRAGLLSVVLAGLIMLTLGRVLVNDRTRAGQPPNQTHTPDVRHVDAPTAPGRTRGDRDRRAGSRP